MTAFDFAVLFGPTRLDVPQADTGFVHGQGKGQGKGQREFRPLVNLNLANGKREDVSHGGQEVETGAVILTRIEA